VRDNQVEWTRKVFITRLWLTVEKLPSQPGTLERLGGIMDILESRIAKPFDVEAIGAAFAVCNDVE
jgi:hypothetical protein